VALEEVTDITPDRTRLARSSSPRRHALCAGSGRRPSNGEHRISVFPDDFVDAFALALSNALTTAMVHPAKQAGKNTFTAFVRAMFPAQPMIREALARVEASNGAPVRESP